MRMWHSTEDLRVLKFGKEKEDDIRLPQVRNVFLYVEQVNGYTPICMSCDTRILSGSLLLRSSSLVFEGVYCLAICYRHLNELLVSRLAATTTVNRLIDVRRQSQFE